MIPYWFFLPLINPASGLVNLTRLSLLNINIIVYKLDRSSSKNWLTLQNSLISPKLLISQSVSQSISQSVNQYRLCYKKRVMQRRVMLRRVMQRKLTGKKPTNPSIQWWSFATRQRVGYWTDWFLPLSWHRAKRNTNV